MWHAWF